MNSIRIQRKISHKTILKIGIVLTAISVGILYFVSQPDIVRGGQVWLGTAQVISPKPPEFGSYEAGSRAEFRAKYSFHYCANTLPSARGQITRPVPYGQAHTAFGPERQSSFTSGFPTGSDAQHRYLFNSTYNQYFNVPTTPGTYWFRYRIGIRNGQNTDRFFEGVAVIKVDPIDVCTFIDGQQDNAPLGYYETVDEQGRRICLDEGDQSLICKVSKNPAFVGDSVTFSARSQSGGNSTFEWFNGGYSSSADADKIETGVTESTYTLTFSNPGVYSVTAKSGSDRCNVGVTVYPDPATDLADLADGEGDLILLDPNAPPGVINFNLDDGGITNDICHASWSAEHVLGCELYKNGEVVPDFVLEDKTSAHVTADFAGVAEKVLSGDFDLSPGTYQIKCLQFKDGELISSDRVSCVQNPDIRER